jgi:hypothetical protein
MKFPAHPVRIGQARRGFPEMKYHWYCAPSCFSCPGSGPGPARTGPAYSAIGKTGHLPVNLRG